MQGPTGPEQPEGRNVATALGATARGPALPEPWTLLRGSGPMPGVSVALGMAQAGGFCARRGWE